MTPKVCTLLFLRDGDRILLAMKKRGFGANRFNGVGGKVEPSETVEQALVRECKEEIGVTPITFAKVGECDFIQQEGDTPWRMYVHIYTCTKWEGEPQETEEMAPSWVRTKGIPYEKMWQDDILWLPKVLDGKKVFGTFTFDEHDAMLTHDVKEVEALPNAFMTFTEG